MICGTCQHDNQPNAKFCAECGAPLARQCPSCGHQLQATAKFCDECGASLTAAPPATARPASSPVRKRVTALFADLVGSTAFAERVDAEAVRAGLAPYFALLQSTIDDHAGTVMKFLGDGMFALFGVPEVAEDDALRAVTAGLDLQRRFRTFAAEIHDRHGIELGLRVGVNTGELVVGDDDVDLVGDVLNTAARLESACAPGHVLVGEDTWRLTRSSVPYEVLGEVRVKGKAEPLATFQVAEHEVGVADDLAPFVGRTDELAALRAVFGEAVGASSARLATVIGDPGVGKTRLAQELRASSEARSFDLRFERRGSTTFTPIADLLREVIGSGSADGVDRLLDGHPEARRLGPVLASFLGHGDLRTTEESFWAVRRLLELLAADSPVIVVVDDIQWAEPLFWDLLDHLVEWTAAPVLLLALARPELRELRPDLAQPGRRVSAAITLQGLDAGTTLELAARLLGIDELPAELAGRLPESTEGNPLFVRELVQMLVDDGVLARDGERVRLTIDADAIEVPPTILSLLASRVERLPDDERQVVELASVIGTEFDRGTLAAIAGGNDAIRLGAVIDRLRRKDLVEPSGQWTGDHPVYRFHHVLIRDAAYRRLLKGHRADLHERVGRHVDTTAIADDERDVIVAHHFEQAYRYRSELGAIDDHDKGLANDAARRLRSAAEQALGREDLAAAGGAAIRALRLLDADAGADRDALLVVGCEALLSSADVTRSAPLVEELSARSSDARLAAWADCFRAQLWSLTDSGRLTEASDVAADAAVRLAAIGDEAGVAKARLVRAACLARLGRVGDCEAELDQALSAARATGDRRRTVAVLGAAPLAALWGPSPVARAGGRCLDVLRLLRITSPSPAVETTSIRCQGMLEALRGRGDAARAKFESSRATARELGLRHALHETELFAGLAELLAGDAVAAESHLRAARAGLGRLGIGADAGQAAALLARSLLMQQRVDEADELATGALETAGQNLQTAIAARAVLAEVRAAQGRHDEASTLAEEALAIVAPTDVTLDHALTLLAAARVATAAGRNVDASRYRVRATELLTAKGVSLRLDTTDNPDPVDGHPANVDLGRSDPGRSDPGRPRLWNQALEAALRATESATAGDRDTFMSCFAPDFATVDHGATASAAGYEGRVGAESWADFALWIMTQSEGSIGEPDPIAVRGDRHALMRWTLHSSTSSFERVVVLASDGEVLVSAHFYDPDQLVDAVDELIRQWSEDDPSAAAWREGLLTGSRVRAAVATGDRDAIRSMLTDDFVAIDHRQLGLPERHADEWVETMAATSRGQAFVAIPVDLLMSDGRRTLTRNLVSVGDDAWHVLTLSELRDGLVARIEHFDGNDVDAATARYRELAPRDEHGRRFTNSAWELGQHFDAAYRRGNRDELRALLAPTFVAEWHHRFAEDGLARVGAEEFVETVIDVGSDFDERTTELVAIRGDRLALGHAITVHAAARQDRHTIMESDGDQLTRMEFFGDDELAAALDALDRRYRQSCGFDDDHWLTAVWPLLYSADFDAMQPVLHPEFEYVERRRLSFPSGDADDLGVYMANYAVVPTVSLPAVHRLSEHGMVYERTERFAVDDLEPAVIQFVIAAEFADGLLRRGVVYDPEDLDRALADFDHRVAAGVTEPGRGPAPNRAYRIADEFGRAAVRRDRDAMLELLADDFTADHQGRFRVSLGVELPGDRVGFVDRVLSGATEDRVTSLARSVVATRGDDLYLAASTMTTVEGDELLNYALGESTGSQLRRMTYFDDSQLEHAVVELDRRYRLSRGIDDDHWLARSWHALMSPDADAYADLLPADFLSFDHRAGALGVVNRDEFIEWLRATPSTNDWSIPAIHRLSDRGIVVEHRETWDGGTGETRTLIVNEFRDGYVRRMDAYGPDDLDAALARYDEIVGSTARLTNAAWEVACCVVAAFNDRDRKRYAPLFADDFVHQPHDRLTSVFGGLDKARFVDASFDPVLWGMARLTPELIAVRGDDLCLFRQRTTTDDGDLYERIILFEVRDGLVARYESWGHAQLLEAQIALDRRWLTSLGFPAEHPWFALLESFYSTDSAAFTSALSDDLHYVDHRRLTYPDGDRSQILANADTQIEDYEVVIPRYRRFADRVALGERIEQTVGGDAQSPGLYVVQLGPDGKIVYMEIFDVDDEAEAIACYDRLTSAERRDTLTNRACAIASAFCAGWVAGDRDTMNALVDPEGLTEARYQLSPWERATLQETVDVALLSRAAVSTARLDLEPVALRDDHLCLVVVDSWYDDDNLRLLAVVETDDDRLLSIIWFDESHLIDAHLELDRRWLASIGHEDHWWVPHWHLAYDPHPDAMFELGLLTPDFEYVEHRPLMFPDGDAEMMRSSIASMQHDVVFTIPRVHRWSHAGSVWERVERAVDEIGEHHILFVTRFEGERIRRVDAFDPADLDEALDLYARFAKG